ncbi:MAG: DNA primase [Kangiellaceae bacterium]|nr:DNA primase [Kangiellaceae bacterium]
MAGRIPQSFINELLARVDIVDVIERRISLKKTGKNYSACCPFHNEKTPSFSVSPDKQFYYCFGCGVSGNALSFIMEYEGQEFVAAIEDLAQSMGMEIPRESFSGGNHHSNDNLYALMDKALLYYQDQLKNSKAAKEAIQYLKNRGLSGEIAKTYGIGYAPEGWQNLSEIKTESKSHQQDLVDTGMMIKNDKGHTYDRFRDRIMFPIRNRRGQTIGFGGRIIDQGEPKYLNSPETKLFHKGQELYGLYEMRKQLRNIDHILIVEGYMDVVALAQFGIFNATATLGTATSSEHLQTLFRICSKVVFCFDGDKAGRAAALRALQNALPLMKDAREIRMMFLPDGEDPDTMVRKIGAEEFNQQVDSSITLFDFLIQHLTSQVDMTTFEGPARLVHIAKPFTEAIKDSILKTRFDQKLASLAGLSEKQYSQATQYSQSQKKQEITTDLTKEFGSPEQEVKPIKIQGKAPFRRAISLLLQNPDSLPAAKLDWINQLDEPGAMIFSKLVVLVNKNEAVTTGMLIENWRGEPEEKHLKALALADLIISKEQIPAELADILNRLEKELIIDEWDRLIAKSKSQPLSPEEKNSLKSLQKEMLLRG